MQLEALDILKSAGREVALTVKHYKSAAPFLLRNFRQLIPEEEGGTIAKQSRKEGGRKRK